MDVNNSTALPMPTCMSQASVNPRKRKAPTLRDDDWEPFKGQITDLYTSGTPLKEVKELIEATSSFRAEIRQYKSRIKRWKLEKNIKSEEMKWIVKKRQRRRLVEAGKRDLRFLVRKNEVNSTKIDRWMRENEVPPDMLYSPKSLPSTPSYITCYTEPGTPVPPSPVLSILSITDSRRFPPLIHAAPMRDVSLSSTISNSATMTSGSGGCLSEHRSIASSSVPYITPSLATTATSPWIFSSQSATISSNHQYQQLSPLNATCINSRSPLVAQYWVGSDAHANKMGRINLPGTHMAPFTGGLAKQFLQNLFITRGGGMNKSLAILAEQFDHLLRTSPEIFSDLQPSVLPNVRTSWLIFKTKFQEYKWYWNHDSSTYILTVKRISLNKISSSELLIMHYMKKKPGRVLWDVSLHLRVENGIIQQHKSHSIISPNLPLSLGVGINGTPEANFILRQDMTLYILLHGISIGQCVHFDEEHGNPLFIVITIMSTQKTLIIQGLEFLLNLGCDIEYRNELGMTPLLYMLHHAPGNNLQVLRFFISRGVNLMAVDNQGRGVLQALFLGFVNNDDLLILLQLGIVNRQLFKYMFERLGIEDMLVELIQAGCDPIGVDRAGMTPTQHLPSNEIFQEAWLSALKRVGYQLAIRCASCQAKSSNLPDFNIGEYTQIPQTPWYIKITRPITLLDECLLNCNHFVSIHGPFDWNSDNDSVSTEDENTDVPTPLCQQGTAVDPTDDQNVIALEDEWTTWFNEDAMDLD